MNPSAIHAEDAVQIRDVHLPLSPEIWPPAPGWWALAVIAIILLFWTISRLRRLRRRNKLQKEILASLNELQRQYSDEQIPHFLAEVSILLRRVALMKFPRQQVAALTGKEWLSFLDQHGGDGQYSNGVGSVLAAGPYTRHSEVDQNALLSLTRKWIKRNTR